jgi:hypothetical protein
MLLLVCVWSCAEARVLTRTDFTRRPDARLGGRVPDHGRLLRHPVQPKRIFVAVFSHFFCSQAFAAACGRNIAILSAQAVGES